MYPEGARFIVPCRIGHFPILKPISLVQNGNRCAIRTSFGTVRQSVEFLGNCNRPRGAGTSSGFPQVSRPARLRDVITAPPRQLRRYRLQSRRLYRRLQWLRSLRPNPRRCRSWPRPSYVRFRLCLVNPSVLRRMLWPSAVFNRTNSSAVSLIPRTRPPGSDSATRAFDASAPLGDHCAVNNQGLLQLARKLSPL